MGLGLAIVQRHLELLGSRLEWESAPGQGSRFYFSIHLEPGAGPEEVDAGSPVRQVLAPGQEVRALVVDDVMENREVLQQILEQLGAQVEVAESGEQAIERMRQMQPHIVLWTFACRAWTAWKRRKRSGPSGAARRWPLSRCRRRCWRTSGSATLTWGLTTCLTNRWRGTGYRLLERGVGRGV